MWESNIHFVSRISNNRGRNFLREVSKEQFRKSADSNRNRVSRLQTKAADRAGSKEADPTAQSV